MFTILSTMGAAHDSAINAQGEPGGAVRPPKGQESQRQANDFVILAQSLFYHILPGNERGRKKVYKFPFDAAAS